MDETLFLRLKRGCQRIPQIIVSSPSCWEHGPKANISSTSQKPVKRILENPIVVKEMSDARPVRCQKCGKPLGYVTVVVKGLTPLSQPLQNLKIIAICIQCANREKRYANIAAADRG